MERKTFGGKNIWIQSFFGVNELSRVFGGSCNVPGSSEDLVLWNDKNSNDMCVR